MREIPLHGKKAADRVAFVDDEDYELVSGYRWRVFEKPCSGTKNPGRLNGPYAMTRIVRDDGRATTIMMHKLITGFRMTDHVNHNGLDNQRINLRPTDFSGNAQNQRPRSDGSSAYKGVHWSKQAGKWRAQIGTYRNDTRRYLGLFFIEADAAHAYDAAAREMYGECACLNFP